MVVVRVLSDHNALHTPAGHIAVGWLVVEDMFTVLALVLLPALFGGERIRTSRCGGDRVHRCSRSSALVAFTASSARASSRGCSIASPLTRSRELFTLTVLVIALGIAVGSARIFGVSMALGAFLAGMVVGRSDYSLRAASDALPMRDAFAVLFFVSVGMLLDPASLLDSPWLLAGRSRSSSSPSPLATFAVMWMVRQPFRAALMVAVALAQIGEFSFILSTLGRELGLLHARGDQHLVAASIVSIVVNPAAVSRDRPDRRVGGAAARGCAAGSIGRV